MKASITVFNAALGKEQEFAIEVDEELEVVTFYLDGKELFRTAVENFEDLITAYGLIWGGWVKVEREKGEAGNGVSPG